MGLNLFKVTIALIWDNNGELFKKKKINKNKTSFKVGDDRTYNIKTKEGSYYDDNHLFYNKRIYQYNVDTPDPIRMDRKMLPLINTMDYNSMLETKHLQKLNDINKGNWLQNIDFKTLITLGIVVVAGYLLITGQLL